ncbi:hypothetical protein PICSAR26_03906 [Mycobacterium avium subsp. paratuberculosis]|nr:hypothetical protein PICSAR26_03906 [Mycobacterium avium subsp. paratuberculosis]
MQDVGCVDEQVGPAEIGQRGDVVAELGQLPLRGAPGEVRIGLGEAQFGQPVLPDRRGEGLGQEQHIGIDALDRGDQPGPEVRRFGVRVVDAKELDAVVDPVPDHPQHLVIETGRVVVEVERIDVLVLLGRVLRVRDGAVRQFGEPVAVLARPRMIRRALQRQVERHLHAQFAGPGDERVEILDGAQIRVDGVVAALVAADRPRRAHIRRAGGGRVVAPLAMYLPDGMDRRQVDDVEAHRRDARQRRGRRREGAVHGVAVVVPAAGRAGEHLIPGAEAGQRPIHPDPVLLAAGQQIAQRILRQDLLDFRRQRQRRPGDRVPGGAQRGRGGQQRFAPGARHTRGGALEQLRADQQIVGQLRLALAGVQLGDQPVPPGVDRVAPAVHPEGP